ncbi:mitochondrial fission 1 protein-like [Lutzomyia longipalpis]|uniref:mitochondrial fission 1 protein-like n=1 Tax=Lutzomyia longipalpis TaxID=7200 RepID=UPI0024843657|nr:mitochondrial fission 1 protein-like [Lutzomyia longipalpis]
MEEILNEIVPPEELEKFEKKYQQELEEQNVTHKTQFEYAWCLVRSNYGADIKKGIILLEDLATRHPEGKRDYIYYLATGHTRIREYTVALKYVRSFLQIEPNNQQVITLEQIIKKKMERDGMIGVAVAGGAALVIGGILGLGFAMAKK